jgi:Ca-activated chloride channel family protein
VALAHQPIQSSASKEATEDSPFPEADESSIRVWTAGEDGGPASGAVPYGGPATERAELRARTRDVLADLQQRQARARQRPSSHYRRDRDEYATAVQRPHDAPRQPVSSHPVSSLATSPDSAKLVEVITSTGTPETWEEVGGTGSISPYETNLSLLISQTQEVHQGVASSAESEVDGLLDRTTSDGDAIQDQLARRSGAGTEMPRPDEGIGPGRGGDRYEQVVDNPFREVPQAPLSTFSIDVDTASYSKVRMYLKQHGTLPPPSAVRIEELINYFRYDYQPPQDEKPFAAHVEVADCPWRAGHRLVRVGIQGKEIDRQQRPASNLVFLLDVSGSMDQPNKLPLVKRSMVRLVDQLGENDRVAIAVYAGAAGLVLPSTIGNQRQTIFDALEQLKAGGSTNGGQGIRLAYQTAMDHFIVEGTNRVILCTDGDFNVGTTSTSELVDLVTNSAQAGVFLSVLGFGMGNHNDAMLEQISNQGNGNYAFIDNDAEARKVLIEQMTGTLVTIAKDVKIQIEFNPAQVAAYRLIGYENRVLAAEDFNDDKKDAGEIGAGHSVTALYEIVPVGISSPVTVPPVDPLKYQQKPQPTEAAAGGELLTLKMRYKAPDGDTSQLLTFPVTDNDRDFGAATDDFRFAAAVASFGMILRDSPHRGDTSCQAVLEIATAAGASKDEYRAEFLQLVQRAATLGR